MINISLVKQRTQNEKEKKERYFSTNIAITHEWTFVIFEATHQQNICSLMKLALQKFQEKCFLTINTRDLLTKHVLNATILLINTAPLQIYI